VPYGPLAQRSSVPGEHQGAVSGIAEATADEPRVVPRPTHTESIADPSGPARCATSPRRRRLPRGAAGEKCHLCHRGERLRRGAHFAGAPLHKLVAPPIYSDLQRSDSRRRPRHAIAPKDLPVDTQPLGSWIDAGADADAPRPAATARNARSCAGVAATDFTLVVADGSRRPRSSCLDPGTSGTLAAAATLPRGIPRRHRSDARVGRGHVGDDVAALAGGGRGRARLLAAAPTRTRLALPPFDDWSIRFVARCGVPSLPPRARLIQVTLPARTAARDSYPRLVWTEGLRAACNHRDTTR
jgi:hypothetical protein